MNVKRIKIPLFIIATLLFGVKTYIVYRFMFTIEIDNSMQELILLINPFVSGFLVFALSVWFKKQSRQMKFLRYTALIGTLILYFNLVFYRSFTDFITIPQLFQGSNMGDLGSSILTLIKAYDIFLFLDVALIWYLSKKNAGSSAVKYPRSGKVFALAMSLVLLAGNFFLAEMERPQLFTRAFDREYLVKNIGLFNYHIYDFAVHSKVKTQRVFADGTELPEIKDYVDSLRSDKQSDLYGIAEGKNVIFISAESLQTFVINNEVNGEEITPFLNSLVDDKDTYYFENFYHQTMQGKTSDSEFLTANSLYPLPRGAVFFTHGQNDYHALPEMLNEEGYYTASFHANNKSFWNRDQMYDSLGFDHFYGDESYEVTKDNSIGWGLKDKPFFEQSIKYLQALDQPFYTKFITLTNHFPFDLDEEDRSIEPYDSNSNTLNNYFPTVRYMDESIEQFFNQLKDAGLYEDSIIIIMGDHYGISANHNKAMSQYLEKEEITPYDHIQLQRVPFFIHIPGSGKGKVMSEVSGQIDIKPTILHLLGIDTENDIYFGNDLFSDDRKGYIAQRNGDFISDKYISTEGICYNRETGEPIEEDQTITETDTESPCTAIEEKVTNELGYSDDIIYGDLFRFVDFTGSD
ncbi:sulfatase-like hydrolase/transferase [Virgibacillus dakarensis]|uniref:Lipoteichoic acid synthase-like YqgS n=1 Tax=Lentibacillus populi TaxID=1827502 RepID=A0A9W5X3S2_9BACI|nr:LTA synthase family protein [Lentibacillus populi]MTW84059.1 sulfatase-like hydrolase/transferase [Virgibacillus dakarensis]GGB29365.1 lipoteichoic acid synthase-like YqgS [Lentibacillus populi]